MATLSSLFSPLPQCPPDRHCLEWVRRYFHDCLCSTRDVFSFVLGLLSVLSWGVAEIPQIVTNFKKKSAEGLSLAFLMTWLIGDIFNLLGCYLEPVTLPTQFYMALLYTITTLILVAQAIYYEYICKRWFKRWTRKDGTLEETLLAQEHAEVAAKQSIDSKQPEKQQWTPLGSRPISPFGISTPARPRVVERTRTEWYYTSARSLASSNTPTAGSMSSSWETARGGGIFRSYSCGPSLPFDMPSSAPLTNTGSALLQTAASSIFCLVGLSLRFGSYFGGMAPDRDAKSAVGMNIVAFEARRLCKGRSYLDKVKVNHEGMGLGELFGWLMAAIYMGGRIPQIWLNIRRGTVKGLNPLMFFFAFFGNLTYVASILVRSLEWSRIKRNLPWLVDAIACILLDLFILCQFYYYTRKERACGDFETLK